VLHEKAGIATPANGGGGEMTIHFLRDEENKTIVDIEAMDDDIRCAVDVEKYTVFLLNLNPLDYRAWMKDVSLIQEIRGYYHEGNEEGLSSDEFAAKWCEEFSRKWKLRYVVD
jgi:hypothetical protein